MKIMSEKRFREEVEREMREEQRYERLCREMEESYRGFYKHIERLEERVNELERGKHPVPECEVRK